MTDHDASLRDYGLAAPHGPNPRGGHVATQDIGDADIHDIHNMSANEKAIFDHLIRPSDSYTEDGVYWADLPFGKKFSFISKVDNEEARKELTAIGRMMKADPLSPLGWYFRNAVIPGAGLLMEGYVLFSIGNLKPLFQQGFPACWSKYEICNETWTQAVDYLEIAGIIVGQILVGFIGDWIGRRWGLIQDATIMFIGLIMLICSWGVTQNGWVICYVWSLFFYGIGVGGEYPMTATSAMENAVGAGKVSTREDRLHRGRKVTTAFLMQGWGQFFNQVVLTLLLIVCNSGSGLKPVNEKVTQWVYRLSFVPPAVGTLWLVYYRTYKMRSASKQLLIAKQKARVTGYDTESLSLTFKYFGFRVFATAVSWYANDVFFYGNKLFQSDFISVLSGKNAPIIVGWNWNLLNVGVELVGYYMASFLIDHKLYGRKWMMIIGFIADFICFTIPAFNYDYYTKTAIKSFQAMYFLSSFFNQFGPNAVTFIVAAEVYPTPVRATAHGFSAACGKAGALTAAILYNYIGTQQRFLVVPWFGLIGAIVTYVFLPDTTGLDLKEAERRWAFLRAGRGSEYHGIAIHPQHLSLWERLNGLSKPYDAQLDFDQKVQEMRGEWEASQARKAEEHLDDRHEDDEWSSDVSSYFMRTGGASIRSEKLGNGNH